MFNPTHTIKHPFDQSDSCSMMIVMSDLEQRIRRAFKILFDDRDRMRKEIEQINEKLLEIEQRLKNLFRIGDN